MPEQRSGAGRATPCHFLKNTEACTGMPSALSSAPRPLLVNSLRQQQDAVVTIMPFGSPRPLTLTEFMVSFRVSLPFFLKQRHLVWLLGRHMRQDADRTQHIPGTHSVPNVS